MSKLYQNIINYFIKNDYKLINLIFYKIFKNFIKSEIILSFSQYKFYASTKKKDLSRWMIKNLDPWNKGHVKLVKYFIKKNNSSFIDCGCNFGSYSIPIAIKFKNKIIYSIDASEMAINKLKKNIELNKLKNIKFFNFGIAEKNKISYFDENLDILQNTGSFRFTTKHTNKKLRIYTLDHLIKKKQIKINKHVVIKIDLEGYDFLALKGMKRILQTKKVIILFEFSKLLLNNTKNFSKEFLKFLKFNKLKIYNIRFNEISLNEILHLLKSIKEERETIGEYIITNHKLI